MSQLLACERERFKIPEHITYLNCAYLSPVMTSVAAAGVEGIEMKSCPWEVFPDHFFTHSSELRACFAQLVGGQPEDVALIPSVSYGIGIAAKNLPLSKGQGILVLADQFPSNYYPWLSLARENGGEIVVVPRPEDGNWTDAVLARLDDRIDIAALPHCHWTDGSLLDLEAIGKRCQELTIPLVVDATQSLGVMPLDVKNVRPAYLAVAAYKWLLGPYSLGLMYVDPAHQQGDPLELNWIARKDSENFSGLVAYTDDFQAGAIRYDVGERSNFILVPMATAALKQILEWGVENIAYTLKTLNEDLITSARDLGFQTIEPEFSAPHLRGLRFKGQLPTSLAASLQSRNIFVSVRGDAIRIAPHLYNNKTDMQRLLQGLEELV